jgi:putative transposase
MKIGEHEMTINPKLLDEVLAEYKKPEDMIGENGLLKQLTKALLERAMQAELTGHLGYEKHDPAGHNSGNSRNGGSRKKLKGDFGEIELETPRDRNGTFEPKIVERHQTRWTGFDDKILSMYSRGMSTRDIQGHLEEIYGVEVSPTLISSVTSAVQEEVAAWQHRPLESRYAIVYMDALYVKMRDNGQVKNRAVYVAIGVNLEGSKEVLGLELLYPRAQVQLCIVHMVRHSLNYVSWKQRRAVAADLRTIYTAATAEGAELALHQFEDKWDASHPTISQVWRRNWERIIPFFAFPAEIRKVIYTTNAVESLNMSLRKIIKTRGSFPNEEAALRLLWLALRNHSKKWSFVQGWREALNRFQILWPERMPALERS